MWANFSSISFGTIIGVCGAVKDRNKKNGAPLSLRVATNFAASLPNSVVR